MAWRGGAGQGKEKAGQGSAWQGAAGPGETGLGEAGRGHGTAWQGEARRGTAGLGKARRRQGQITARNAGTTPEMARERQDMAIQEIRFRLTGITPILTHNGQTADPLNQFARAMKRLSGKRNKTDEDLETMSIMEWWAGLYLSDAPTIDGDSVTPADGTKLIIPAHLLDSCIREGARKAKMGKQASAGCIVNGDGDFMHDGPSSIAKLAKTTRHFHRAAVKVGAAKVMRTRPIFPVWSVEFSCSTDNTVIEADSVLQALQNAGKLVGIGDWRPGAPRGGSFGRFEAEVI